MGAKVRGWQKAVDRVSHGRSGVVLCAARFGKKRAGNLKDIVIAGTKQSLWSFLEANNIDPKDHDVENFRIGELPSILTTLSRETGLTFQAAKQAAA